MTGDKAAAESAAWWRSRLARRLGPTVALVVTYLVLFLIQEADPTEGDRYSGNGVRVEAEVLHYTSPRSSRDDTGVVAVAFPVGSSEMRVDIETVRTDFGPTVDVIYNPDNPGQARVADE